MTTPTVGPELDEVVCRALGIAKVPGNRWRAFRYPPVSTDRTAMCWCLTP
jgi:hypothetical protein